MRNKCALVCSLALLFCHQATAADRLKVVSTTTLNAEIGNNTSTADSFPGTPNGNPAAGNVSKMPIRDLLYSNSDTKVMVAAMGWFGKSSHISVGYNSADPAQVKRQLADMKSRGIDGLSLAWYGKNETELSNMTAKQIMLEAEARGDFFFALRPNEGIINWYSEGMSATDALINHLKYAAATYFPSPAYLKVNGRPVIFEFGLSTLGVDWTRVRNEVPGNILVIFRNPGGITNTGSDGGFAWGPADDVSYLDRFYSTATANPKKLAFGGASKGFNDSIASWSKDRIVSQRCGQTWLENVARAGKYYSDTSQLGFVQIATWNDYEEGTALEPGIDNCLSISASVSGDTLSWNLTGTGLSNTVDHFTVFVSTDGQNLMKLADMPVSTRGTNISNYNLAPGSYQFFVKAVGKASIRNHMSNAAAYGVSNISPYATVVADKSSTIVGSSITADASGSSDADGDIVQTSINFGDGTASVVTSKATHSYSKAGTFVVSAKVTDDLGASSSASTTVVVTNPVNQPPIAKLSLSTDGGIGPVTVTASTSGSSDPDGTIKSITIDFGDGYVATGSSATHTYTESGTFTVKTTVTDNGGATASASGSVKVDAGVELISPTTTTVSRSVRVTARAFSSKPITSMQVYVDGVRKYSTSSSKVDTWVSMKAGTRLLEVRAWNSAGSMYKVSRTLTVK